MKFAVGLTLAALATAVPVFAGPGRLDTSKRANRVSTAEKAVLPETKPIERNEVLLEKRVETETIPHQEALVGERRSPIEMTETREKTLFSTPEQKKYDVVPRKESPWAGKQSRYSTADDAFRSKVATRFQDKIGEASPVSHEVKPAVSQRTTFDKINRFAFRKNADQGVSVTRAGDGLKPADASGAWSPASALKKNR